MKWQRGKWERHAQYRFLPPYPFLLLCHLTGTTPETVRSYFMENGAHGSWKPAITGVYIQGRAVPDISVAASSAQQTNTVGQRSELK